MSYHHETWSKWLAIEGVLLTKLRNDASKIVDFLSVVNFWPCAFSLISLYMQFLRKPANHCLTDRYSHIPGKQLLSKYFDFETECKDTSKHNFCQQKEERTKRYYNLWFHYFSYNSYSICWKSQQMTFVWAYVYLYLCLKAYRPDDNITKNNVC